MLVRIFLIMIWLGGAAAVMTENDMKVRNNVVLVASVGWPIFVSFILVRDFIRDGRAHHHG